MPLATRRAPPAPHASLEPPARPDAMLLAEGRALGRWIIGRPVDAEFVERYASAHAHLLLTTDDPGDRAVLAYAIAHPRLLPPLDAASALVRPQSILHRKALLMTAILEASPTHAEMFLPRTRGWAGLLALAAGVGIVTVMQLALGLPLLALLRRRARVAQ